MTDVCCHLCKGAHGICLSRYQCEHHRARKLYNNPTADEAINNVMRSRKGK